MWILFVTTRRHSFYDGYIGLILCMHGKPTLSQTMTIAPTGDRQCQAADNDLLGLQSWPGKAGGANAIDSPSGLPLIYRPAAEFHIWHRSTCQSKTFSLQEVCLDNQQDVNRKFIIPHELILHVWTSCTNLCEVLNSTKKPPNPIFFCINHIGVTRLFLNQIHVIQISCIWGNIIAPTSHPQWTLLQGLFCDTYKHNKTCNLICMIWATEKQNFFVSF